MKNPIFPIFGSLLFGATAHAALVVQDGFSTYGSSSTLPGTSWNTKWVAGTQQNLVKTDATGSFAVLDTSVAIRNYHAVNQTSWTMGGAGTSATIALDFRYDHLSGGDITTNFNKAFMSILVGVNNEWWEPGFKTFNVVNRGSAIGNSLNIAPWVEGWQSHSSLGVNTATGGMSHTIGLTLTLTDNGTTILGQMAMVNKTTDTPLYTTTQVNMGIASGSTLYGGFSTAYNDVGDVSISSFSKVSKIEVDNFTINYIPEPSAFALVGLGLLGFAARRRR